MKKLLLAFTFLSFSLTAQAQDAIYLSGMLGMTSVSYGNASLETDAELSYGLRAGVLFNDHFSAGLYVHRYAGSDSNILGASADVTLTNIMAELTYYFLEADENTFWVSGLLGTTQGKVTSNASLLNSNESETAFGFSLGYHFMVAPNFSVSPQLTYVTANGENTDFNETSGLVNLTFWM